MSECRRCDSISPNGYLCGRCVDQIRTILAEMPWWLHRLTETALGQTRMSDNAGRKSAARRDLDGDLELAACIDRLPAGQDDLEKARKARERAALARALAAGGINANASELLARIADSLGYWVKVLCDERGADYRPVASPVSALGARYAAWLAVNVNAIALSDSAGDITTDVEGHLDDILRTINRPIPTLPLGDCPTYDEERQRYCGRALRAPQGSLEIHCRRCGTTHSVPLLLKARREEYETTPHTWTELRRYNAEQPPEFRVALRTLQHWRATEVLEVRGWLRPDGHRGIARHGEKDEPLYLWSDVVKLVVGKPQKAPTGAAARRNTPA